MKRTIEVELKFNILNPTQNIDLPLAEGKRVVDIYYDTADGVHFKKGVFIRVRNDQKLDFKYNYEDLVGLDVKNDHTHCDENSFELPLQTSKKQSFAEICKLLKLNVPEVFTLDEFIKINNFKKLATVDKTRQHAAKNGFEISLDEIKDLGTFIEVERVIELDIDENEYSDSLEELKQEIHAFVQSLNLDVKQNGTGYCELVLRETNFDLYRQGKYVLEEDK